jgi:hypothetical protein
LVRTLIGLGFYDRIFRFSTDYGYGNYATSQPHVAAISNNVIFREIMCRPAPGRLD